ncbi:MAG: 23S rRNA (guanosine(2251)-2'-O)-methyltransferase RlmB [Candidatus Dasytiphilus stammeri]
MNEFIFGIHTVHSLLQFNPERCKQIYITNHVQNPRLNLILNLIKNQGILIKKVSGKWLDSKSKRGVHQGIIAKISSTPLLAEKDLVNFLKFKAKNDLLLLILDCIKDPHNLGACIRSAYAAGVDAVIVPKNRSAKINNAVVKKVASGGVENLAIFTVINISRTLQILHKYNIKIIGTSDTANHNLFESSMTGALALVMGSEEKGLRNLTRKYCDDLINIPMLRELSSLNVSVATAICLFETIRQRLFNKKL